MNYPNIKYKKLKNFLSKEEILDNKYIVCGVLTQSGFGITYLCENDK